MCRRGEGGISILIRSHGSHRDLIGTIDGARRVSCDVQECGIAFKASSIRVTGISMKAYRDEQVAVNIFQIFNGQNALRTVRTILSVPSSNTTRLTVWKDRFFTE